MPITKSAIKKLRVDRRRREVNLPVISKFKNAFKRAYTKPSEETIAEAYSAIDKAKKKKIIKPNKASRLKARLAKKVTTGVKK